MLGALQNNPLIHEKDLGNNIHSFNFSSRAFYTQAWNEQTITARGLFVDMDSETVFARSYNKFFNMDERKETQFETLAANLEYPVKVFQKENGYLGIMSVHNGIPHFFSKSTNKGWFAETFKDIFMDNCGNKEGFYKYLEENNYSAVFEVISKEDRHFVDYYGKDTVVLLDIINNDFEFNHVGYTELGAVAIEFNLPIKQLETIIYNEADFVSQIPYLEQRNSIEGFVFVDSVDFMFKLKTRWYRFWKAIRSRGGYIFRHSDVYHLRDIPAHRDLDYCNREAKELADKALSYYAFARDTGNNIPHIMDIIQNLDRYYDLQTMNSMI